MNGNEEQSTMVEQQPKAPMILRVRADYLAVAAMFRTIGEKSDVVGCVRVEPLESGGVMLSANNGHLACWMRDADGEASSPMLLRVSKSLLSECCKQDKGGLRMVNLREERLFITDSVGFREYYIQPGDSLWPYPELFPPVIEKIGAWSQGEPVTMEGLKTTNMALISDAVGMLAKAHGCAGGGSLFFRQSRSTHAIMLRTGCCEDFFAVVMPLKVLGEEYENGKPPAWLLEKSAEAVLARAEKMGNGEQQEAA